MMTLTQLGLLADIVGFTFLAGSGLFWTKVGIPFAAKMWEPKWWVMVTGVSLVVGGFFLQLLATL